MFLIPGMVAYALAQKTGSGIVMDITNAHDTDGAFAMMVKNILPAGIKGIVTIGFICALVASLAAFFNSCATLFTEDFYKPMKKGMSESHYVLVGRIATVVVVLLGLAWMPIMMNMGNLYSYLQDIQSLIAPAMVAVFTLGIFSKRITPKAGEWGLIGGFLIGMVRWCFLGMYYLVLADQLAYFRSLVACIFDCFDGCCILLYAETFCPAD